MTPIHKQFKSNEERMEFLQRHIDSLELDNIELLQTRRLLKHALHDLMNQLAALFHTRAELFKEIQTLRAWQVANKLLTETGVKP